MRSLNRQPIFYPYLVCVAAGSRAVDFFRQSREMLGKILRNSAAKTLPRAQQSRQLRRVSPTVPIRQKKL